MIERVDHVRAIERQLKSFPVVAIVGMRQVGKTTLARQVAAGRSEVVHYFDLENEEDRARLVDPGLTLKELRGLIILDEIQHSPDLFMTLRVLADRPRKLARFLVLGSASGDLLRQSSESLAGRISYHHVAPLSLAEISTAKSKQLWLRGGLPRSYLARSNRASLDWRKQFIRTFLERDLGQFGLRLSATTMRRFWTMLAHYHGQLFNAAELARSLGVDHKTTRRYLDLLTDTFAVHQLQPWHANLKKRQVKSPKIYLSDTGLLHSLLGIDDLHALEGHPKLGASWEGFMIQEVLDTLGLGYSDAWFWAVHSGAELDLLVRKGRKVLGFEFKRSTAPRLTTSMRTALEDLGLTHLYVVHAGEHDFPMAKRISALAAHSICSTL